MHRTPEEIRLKLEDCVKGRLYKFKARNFRLGVYDGDKGFIGIREKFGSRFLDTEYHWDSECYGTVWDIQDTGIDLILISPQEDFGSQDTVTGRPVAWNEEKKWHFIDTGESSEAIRSVRVNNTALFTWLDDHYKRAAREREEEALRQECSKCKAAPGIPCVQDEDLRGQSYHWHRSPV